MDESKGVMSPNIHALTTQGQQAVFSRVPEHPDRETVPQKVHDFV